MIFDRLRQMPVYEASVEIGEATNNVAELEAIHNALLWILENARAVLTQPAHVRLYTDSELARNFLQSTTATSLRASKLSGQSLDTTMLHL